MLPPGDWVELLFPRESFGSYGSPDGWRETRSMILSFFREKTDLDHGEISVCLQPVYGERRLHVEGPRLTELGLVRVLCGADETAGHNGFQSSGDTGRNEPPFAFGTLDPSNLRRLATAVPRPIPIPMNKPMRSWRVKSWDRIFRSPPTGVPILREFRNGHISSIATIS